MKTSICWIGRDVEIPPGNERILVFSPAYEDVRKGHEMTYRVISSEFLKICVEATHWARLEPPYSDEISQG